MESKQLTWHVNTKAGSYFAMYTHNEELNWNLVGLIPQTYLNTESKVIRTEIIMVVFLCIIFSLLFTMFISSGISSPLKKLVKGMNQVMKGDLQVSIRDGGRDE